LKKSEDLQNSVCEQERYTAGILSWVSKHIIVTPDVTNDEYVDTAGTRVKEDVLHWGVCLQLRVRLSHRVSRSHSTLKEMSCFNETEVLSQLGKDERKFSSKFA